MWLVGVLANRNWFPASGLLVFVWDNPSTTSVCVGRFGGKQQLVRVSTPGLENSCFRCGPQSVDNRWRMLRWTSEKHKSSRSYSEQMRFRNSMWKPYRTHN